MNHTCLCLPSRSWYSFACDTYVVSIEWEWVCRCEVDLLVNNAGRSQRAWVTDTPLQIDRDLINVNVIGPISLTKCVLPHMIARRHGYILVTSSITGKMRKASLSTVSIHCVQKKRRKYFLQYLLQNSGDDDEMRFMVSNKFAANLQNNVNFSTSRE